MQCKEIKQQQLQRTPNDIKILMMIACEMNLTTY